jgi:glyoxylase-like metal-dependent hydrolase (beta-lactamase superfamily II)
MHYAGIARSISRQALAQHRAPAQGCRYHPPMSRRSLSTDLDVVVVDTRMGGLESITAVYYLPGPHPAIVDTGPAVCLDQTLTGLEAAGADRVEWIVLTHIHLDHAGAAGQLAERFPEARIVVRAEGAPHLVDPSRLWASVARLFPDMEERWGRMVPIPEERIVAVPADGPVAALGAGRRLEAVYAPGHAKHHMALWEAGSRTLFPGDAIGIFLPGTGAFRPATPPPEFSLELALESIQRLRRLGAERMYPTHFGPVPDPETAFDRGAAEMQEAVAVATPVVEAGGGIEEVAAALRTRRPASSDRSSAERLDRASSDNLNAAGIYRYLVKRSS